MDVRAGQGELDECDGCAAAARAQAPEALDVGVDGIIARREGVAQRAAPRHPVDHRLGVPHAHDRLREKTSGHQDVLTARQATEQQRCSHGNMAPRSVQNVACWMWMERARKISPERHEGADCEGKATLRSLFSLSHTNTLTNAPLRSGGGGMDATAFSLSHTHIHTRSNTRKTFSLTHKRTPSFWQKEDGCHLALSHAHTLSHRNAPLRSGGGGMDATSLTHVHSLTQTHTLTRTHRYAPLRSGGGG